MDGLRIVAVAFAIALLAGCADPPAPSKLPERARAALEAPDHFELLSLDPAGPRDGHPDDFHGWKVLGRTPVEAAETRAELMAALEQGARENTGTAAGCFNPRHGIRATRGGQTADLVICFECFQVQVYAGDTRDGGFLTTRSPQPVFDQVLRDAGLPLAGAAKN
jgi:hypothetical protein